MDFDPNIGASNFDTDTVYVTGLPTNVTEAEIEQHFGEQPARAAAPERRVRPLHVASSPAAAT